MALTPAPPTRSLTVPIPPTEAALARRSADGTGNNRRAATQKGHDNDTGGLQEAIPGAKALAPKKTKKTPAAARVEEPDADTYASLRARIAELEALQSNVSTPMRAQIPRGAGGTPGGARAATPQGPAPRTPAATASGNSANSAGNESGQGTKTLKMIARPNLKKEPSIQIGMRLARSTEGAALYATARPAVQDCVRRADMDLAVPWDKQPLDKRLLVINARLAQQFLKNKRNRAYATGALERPEGYDHLKSNAAMRSSSGSRVKKAKGVLEARLAKRALQGDDREEPRPRKKARASNGSSENNQPEFVQGSSRDVQDPTLGTDVDWNAHPQVDHDYVPEDDRRRRAYDMRAVGLDGTVERRAVDEQGQDWSHDPLLMPYFLTPPTILRTPLTLGAKKGPTYHHRQYDLLLVHSVPPSFFCSPVFGGLCRHAVATNLKLGATRKHSRKARSTTEEAPGWSSRE
ncbi:hypothetical protein B0H14DRAFT_2560763 [Mycena olivaceomarginata]|nr:hypothetical protein B0H14DRAFT_2560763 [Mycena olivaceomarginata]